MTIPVANFMMRFFICNIFIGGIIGFDMDCRHFCNDDIINCSITGTGMLLPVI